MVISTSEIETLLKVLAILSAGAYFLWKVVTGWMIINLKLSLTVDRAPKNSELDYLAITLLLEKGTTNSVWLQDVTAKVVAPISGQTQYLSLSEELKWLVMRQDKNGDRTIDWSECIVPKRNSALSPGESTTISRVTEVQSGEPASIEVAVYGRIHFWPRGFQWRASAISLPLSPKPSGA